jgi:hypothetical protein
MAFTYVLTENVGRLRALIPDSNSSSYIFEDDELDLFYTLEGSSLKRATALALETIASNEVMVLKVIDLLDLSTDGAKVSDALLKRAALLRAQANDDDVASDGAFDIAEMVVDTFTYRQHWWNGMLRS